MESQKNISIHLLNDIERYKKFCKKYNLPIQNANSLKKFYSQIFYVVTEKDEIIYSSKNELNARDYLSYLRNKRRMCYLRSNFYDTHHNKSLLELCHQVA